MPVESYFFIQLQRKIADKIDMEADSILSGFCDPASYSHKTGLIKGLREALELGKEVDREIAGKLE